MLDKAHIRRNGLWALREQPLSAAVTLQEAVSPEEGGFAPEASDPHAELHGQRSSDESGRLPLLFESFINSLTLNCGSDVKRCRAGRDGHTG